MMKDVARHVSVCIAEFRIAISRRLDIHVETCIRISRIQFSRQNFNFYMNSFCRAASTRFALF